MNERIKAARKALGLTMEQFGKRVGLSKSAISLIEEWQKRNDRADSCVYLPRVGVNGMWLRTGEGEMFDQSTESSLDRLAAEYHLDERKKSHHLRFPQAQHCRSGGYPSLRRFFGRRVVCLAPGAGRRCRS